MTGVQTCALPISDGYKLSWVLSIPRDAHRGVAPFLIQDETPREERVPRQMTHRNQVRGIGTVTVAVSDIVPVRQWYARVLGAAGEDVSRNDLAAAGVLFTIGPHAIQFLAPRGAGSPLTGWLEARGPSPYAATLLTASGRAPVPEARVGPLDQTKTVGARFSFAGD